MSCHVESHDTFIVRVPSVYETPDLNFVIVMRKLLFIVEGVFVVKYSKIFY